MVNDDPLRLDAAVILQSVDDQLGALQLVFQVRRVNEDQLIVIFGDLHVLLEDGQLIAAVLVQPDLANAEHI